MTLQLFEAVTADSATRRLFRYLSFAHGGAAVLTMLFGGFSALALSVLCLIAVSHGINRRSRYRRSPFALIASVTICVYFVLPAVFMAVLGSGYQFGEGLASMPRENADYARSAPFAIAYLAVLLFALAAGLSIVVGRQEPSPARLVGSLHADMPVGLLAIVVLVLAQLSNDALLLTRATGASTAESLWGFIFFDHAYLMLLPVVVSRRLLRPGPVRRLIVNWQFAFILLLFMLQATIGSTSKGFILTLFLLSFVMPLSYLQSSRSVLFLMPSRLTLVAGIVASVWIFFVAQALRVIAFTGGTVSLATLASAVFSGEAQGSLGSMLVTIGYRVATGLDRYVLLFTAHAGGAYSSDYALQFAQYLGKNLLNLVLPGTPFLDAYAPSSNLMPAVLSSSPLVGEASKAELLLSLNTQPYTLFGVLVLLCGPLAPLAAFTAGGLLALVYRLTRHVALRLGLVYLFNAALHAYGIEVVVANAVHLVVSMIIFVWLLRGWRRLRTGLRGLRLSPRTEASAMAMPR